MELLLWSESKLDMLEQWLCLTPQIDGFHYLTSHYRLSLGCPFTGVHYSSRVDYFFSKLEMHLLEVYPYQKEQSKAITPWEHLSYVI